MSHIGSMLFIYAETSLHAGSGVALGAVDLPIQRERMSGLPLVQGSGIKGALREQLREALREIDPTPEHLWLTLFGHEPRKNGQDEQEMFAGALSLTDARLLLLPVRTVVGGWAWATCPMILDRLLRDLETVKAGELKWAKAAPEEGRAYVDKSCTVLASEALLIEDLEFEATREAEVSELATWLQNNAFPAQNGAPSYDAFRKRLPGQLVVLADTDFKFLAEHATEVVTRIKINSSTGTVDEGALWTEESLPSETILYSIALFSNGRRPLQSNKKDSEPKEPKRKDYSAEALRGHLHDACGKRPRIHLGGDRTTGRGLVAIRATKGGA